MAPMANAIGTNGDGVHCTIGAIRLIAIGKWRQWREFQMVMTFLPLHYITWLSSPYLPSTNLGYFGVLGLGLLDFPTIIRITVFEGVIAVSTPQSINH